MRSLWTVRAGLAVYTLLLSEPVWADAFVEFFYKQKMGQEITVTGGFRRFSYKRKFFQRDFKTGKVEHFEFFGMTMVPTRIIGNGSLSLRASMLDTLLFLYPDEELVKDLPERGENLWFTGTLIGFQYGTSGITSAPGSGGDPYILLKRVSTQPPDEASATREHNPKP